MLVIARGNVDWELHRAAAMLSAGRRPRVSWSCSSDVEWTRSALCSIVQDENYLDSRLAVGRFHTKVVHHSVETIHTGVASHTDRTRHKLHAT